MSTAISETKIDLRAPISTRELIDQAASLVGKNRTTFILDASREKAQEVLADQTKFVLSAKQMKAFIALLDAPLANTRAIARLLAKPAPWNR